MIMQVRKPENEGTSLRSSEKKNLEKDLNKIEVGVAEGK